MNVAANLEIATIIETNPVAVLLDAGTYSTWYRHIKAETDAHVPDLLTAKGRDAIKSLAFKVTRSKTAIDAAGKKLNEDARAQIDKVDEVRRKIKGELDALAGDVRKPLTDWEASENKRKREMDAILNRIAIATIGTAADTSEVVAAKLASVEAEVITQEMFQDELEEAVGHKERAIRSLTTSLVRAKQAEADRDELERLRAEQAQRDRAEQEAAATRQAEEQKAEQARIEQERAKRAAEEEQRRIDNAAEAARAKAERDAEAQRQQIAREHQAALDRAEAEKQAVIDAAARAEHQRETEAKQAADDQAKRDADKKHKAKVMGAAKDALMLNAGIEEEAARKIVLAILANQIPNIILRF